MDESAYVSPAADQEPATAELVAEEAILAQPLPRLWPTLVVGAMVIPVCVVIGGIVLLIGLAASGTFQPGMTESDIYDALAQLAESPGGILLLVVPGQLMFMAAAIAPALLSSVPFRERLGLVRSRDPWWLYPLLMLATPLFSMLGSIPAMLLMEEPSESLQLLYSIASDATGSTALLICFLFCVVPAISEELLFRGYLQRRLLQRWNPLLVIVTTGVLFSISHYDAMHAAAIFPLGLWLGFVAWRTGSILPAVACHFFNNLLSLVATWIYGDPFATGLIVNAETLVILSISTAAFVATMIVFARYRGLSAAGAQAT